jgi:hypothetical protein
MNAISNASSTERTVDAALCHCCVAQCLSLFSATVSAPLFPFSEALFPFSAALGLARARARN